MTDIGQIGLSSLSTDDLRRLLANFRQSGRVEAAQSVLRELERRHAVYAGLDPAPPAQWGGRRRAMAAGVGLAAVLAISAAVLTPLISRFGDKPAVEESAPASRAMVALSPTAAPEGKSPTLEESPSRSAAPAAAETKLASAPPRRMAGSKLDLPQAAPRPESQPRLAAASERPIGKFAAVPSAETGEPSLAVSRAPALLAASCGSSEGSARLVCDDARRAALNGRQSRGAPIPVRVAIAPGGSRALAAPSGARP